MRCTWRSLENSARNVSWAPRTEYYDKSTSTSQAPVVLVKVAPFRRLEDSLMKERSTFSFGPLPRRKLAGSRIVLEEHVEPAMEYYEQALPRITPYFFYPQLVRLVGFQQLIVSSIYQIKREDARTSKGVDYVRECVSKIQDPHDLIDVMRSWLAFDLNLTCPAFRNPLIATYIRKNYCLIGAKYFDCHNCPRTPCRENLLWEQSFIGLDVDAHNNLEETYRKFLDFFETHEWSAAFKLSSLKGFHVNVALPRDSGSTPFDRNIFQWIVIRELQQAGLPVDDNSLDPVPILRAPFALHYRLLTPSLPFNEQSLDEAIEILTRLSKMEPKERIAEAIRLVRSWKWEWRAEQVSPAVFIEALKKWRAEAEKAVFREDHPRRSKTTAASWSLRKGKAMTDEEAREARSILIVEGKTEPLAQRIVAGARRREPKQVQPKVKEVRLVDQSDVPEVVLNIPPPLLFLLIDNSTVHEVRELTGGEPVPVTSLCKTTSEGMITLFQRPRFFKRYGQKWNTKTAYIGGLHSAYLYCASADQVLSVKEASPWERDSKVIDELEERFDRKGLGAIVVHLLGLDYCKDQGLPTDGAMLVFKRLTRAALGTDRNIVVTSDHSGEPTVPFFALLTSPGTDMR